MTVFLIMTDEHESLHETATEARLAVRRLIKEGETEIHISNAHPDGYNDDWMASIAPATGILTLTSGNQSVFVRDVKAWRTWIRCGPYAGYDKDVNA